MDQQTTPAKYIVFCGDPAVGGHQFTYAAVAPTVLCTPHTDEDSKPDRDDTESSSPRSPRLTTTRSCKAKPGAVSRATNLPKSFFTALYHFFLHTNQRCYRDSNRPSSISHHQSASLEELAIGKLRRPPIKCRRRGSSRSHGRNSTTRRLVIDVEGSRV